MALSQIKIFLEKLDLRQRHYFVGAGLVPARTGDHKGRPYNRTKFS